MDHAPEIIARKFLNRTGRHVFLTGRAGTGKTTFLREIVERTHKKAVIAAPTGVAAINAGGVTLHSLFQLPFGTYLPSNQVLEDAPVGFELNTPRSIMRNVHMHASKRRLLQEIELLIIDEVSMLRADILDAVDRVLRSVRRRLNVPFGGIQVLFIGDLLQLPPVVKDDEWALLRHHYPSIHFFEAKALQERPPIYIELEKIYRQSDPEFITLLNHLRDNEVTRQDIERLNRHYRPGFTPGPAEGYIHLTTHNRIADAINRRELERLEGTVYTYECRVEGDFTENQYPVESVLELKEGAQVMFIKNDYSGKRAYFNGKIGTVIGLDSETIEVGFNDGSDPVEVEPYEWINKRYRLDKGDNQIMEEKIGSFIHYPIKLAWAVTIHKSQGLTFDRAIIDVQKAFAPGQVYVALSRLVSLDGLVLASPVPARGFMKDEHIVSFTRSRQSDQELGVILETESHLYLKETLQQIFDLTDLQEAFRHHLTTYNKDEKRSAKQRYHERIRKIAGMITPEMEVASKFRDQLSVITSRDQDARLVLLKERVAAARNYFERSMKNVSGAIDQVIRELEDAVGVKTFLSELDDLDARIQAKVQAMHKALALVEATGEGRELGKEEMQGKSKKEKVKSKKDKGESEGARRKKQKAKSNGQKATGRVRKRVDTKKMSFDLFREGKTVKEIAKERELTVSTIETHLAHFIGTGEIDLFDLVGKTKVNRIRQALEKVNSHSLKDVKQHLGRTVTYGEIKMVMAGKLKQGKSRK
jgi:hypothetical protein